MFDAGATELYALDPTSVDRGLHLHAAFVRAARAIETTSIHARTGGDGSATGSRAELEVEDARTLRAIVRGAAAAYARRLREEGVTPERRYRKVEYRGVLCRLISCQIRLDRG